MQNSVISTWITSLYGSNLSCVVFACKAAPFGPDLLVSMCTRPHLLFCAYITEWLAPELLVSLGSSPHLWFCAFKTATLGPRLHVPMGPRPHLWFSACKTACLVSELQLSMDPIPHVWFLNTKQGLLDPNNESLWVQDITCRFVNAIQRD